ncbi:hypothetical protein evm_014816 [Chilo suppressalis]|nr:hypothetical protein evm_014816 [Chilo suppressalis]
MRRDGAALQLKNAVREARGSIIGQCIRPDCEGLRLLDYEYLLKKNYNNEATPMSTRDLEVNLENHLEHLNETHLSRKFNLYNKRDKNQNAVRNLVTEYIKIFENKKLSSELKAYSKRINYEHVLCSSLAKKGYKKKKMAGILSKCSSRRYSSIDDYLYEVITNILNRHTTTIKFTIKMTKILLRKILGPNTDLRNGFLDVNLILQYLRHVLSHLEPRDEKPSIKLKTQHCFNLHISGCFCKPGLVLVKVTMSKTRFQVAAKKFLWIIWRLTSV